MKNLLYICGMRCNGTQITQIGRIFTDFLFVHVSVICIPFEICVSMPHLLSFFTCLSGTPPPKIFSKKCRKTYNVNNINNIE